MLQWRAITWSARPTDVMAWVVHNSVDNSKSHDNLYHLACPECRYLYNNNFKSIFVLFMCLQKDDSHICKSITLWMILYEFQFWSL